MPARLRDPGPRAFVGAPDRAGLLRHAVLRPGDRRAGGAALAAPAACSRREAAPGSVPGGHAGDLRVGGLARAGRAVDFRNRPAKRIYFDAAAGFFSAASLSSRESFSTR